MPCYLFTYHTYGSWLPDHRKGFVLRKEGIQPTNVALAKTYRQRMQESEVKLSAEQQRSIIETLNNTAAQLNTRLHFAATEANHIHVLTSWNDEKPWLQRRNSYKRSITIMLKSDYWMRTWLSEGSSRRQVKDRDHFGYLMRTYLLKHRGWKWTEHRGLFK